jgi:large subunit ribosomal protein L24
VKVKTDDTVIVISGKDKGKKGKILKVDKKKGKVWVKSINMQAKHKKQTRTERAEIKHLEGPIDVSNVMFYDERAEEPTKIGYKFVEGKKIRFAKKTGEEIG